MNGWRGGEKIKEQWRNERGERGGGGGEKRDEVRKSERRGEGEFRGGEDD